MQKPDFEWFRDSIDTIESMSSAFDSIYADKQTLENAIKDICSHIAANMAREGLSKISVEEMKNAKAGIRVAALQEAGYTDLGKLSAASGTELTAIDGIGDKQLEIIRNIVTEFANSLSSSATIRLDADDKSEDNQALILLIAKYRKSEAIRAGAKSTAAQLQAFARRLDGKDIIKNGFFWFFSGKSKKESTLKAAADLEALFASPVFSKIVKLLDKYQKDMGMALPDALEDFKANSADYYAVLEQIGAAEGYRPFLYDNMPTTLAQEVEATKLNLDSFKGNLRAYQLFGAKYIIHQGKVLLGDEMGLGKTVQAIAAMSHLETLKAEGEKNFYLVVCPASVLINWGREIVKFTQIKPTIIHGNTMEAAFAKWKKEGGVAITNFESMGKIVDGIDNQMRLSMLVIDEAHYIKNPDAKRTTYIRRLDNESDRILLMTGTPLENKVEEMCNLIDFVRPDMTAEVKGLAHLASLPEFKEKLSPVYLRRTREQVLQELPPIDMEDEWCPMTDDDRDMYKMAVIAGNFTAMRRVSFIQDNIEKSSKVVRMLEILDEARDEGRKVVIYSFFRDTISKVGKLLGARCIGVITGDTKVEDRQPMVDNFSKAPDGSVLLCQIQAGGVGLNIQSASIVIFCEPQIKPSLMTQALSRVYRMGQIKNVLVYNLLCPNTADEKMMKILAQKQFEFDSFANESAIADALDNRMDTEWIQKVIAEEAARYNEPLE